MPSLIWIASLACLVAVFDRFYLTRAWLLVDPVQHQLHTVALVFLPPVLWACVAWLRASMVGSAERQAPSIPVWRAAELEAIRRE
jgi:hypothetical protein